MTRQQELRMQIVTLEERLRNFSEIEIDEYGRTTYEIEVQHLKELNDELKFLESECLESK